MARGDIITLANGAATLRPTADAARSIVVNNRNNGNVYVAADQLPDTKFFDYIVGPNNTARLPGLFRETVGLYYQDLSGAGVAGQIEWYRSDRLVDAPEYGPIGSALQTTFANVDLAQVATPAAPANGFSRLFASAVDSQLWYELPSGVLVPVTQQAKLQLDSISTTDLANPLALPAGVWTDVTSAVSYTIDDTNSIVEFSIKGVFNVSSSTANTSCAARMVADGSAIHMLGGAVVPSAGFANALSGSGSIYLTGFNAGTHNVKLQAIALAAANLFCRPSTQPSTEFLRIQVIELKR